MTLLPTHQRMYYESITAATLADQLSARFNDRQHQTQVEIRGETAFVQIGSKHGTPVTLQIILSRKLIREFTCI